MSNGIVISQGIRNSLFSLNNASQGIQDIQKKLATGLKVGSALDGAQSFFAAQGLNNRANDLSRLLDSMGQSIQTIKAADNAVTSLTKLVEQADSIVSSARDALSAGQAEAKVSGTKSLKGVEDITGLAGVADGDTITFSLTDQDGDPINVKADPSVGSGSATVDVTLEAGDTIDDVLTKINNIRDDDGNKVLEAKLNDSGALEIRSLNGGSMTAVFDGGGAAAGTTSQNLALSEALGFGQASKVLDDGNAATEDVVGFTALADTALRSTSLRVTGGDVATRSTLLSDLEDSSGNALFADLTTGDAFRIAVNGKEAQTVSIDDTATIQSFIDDLNTAFDGTLKASYDESSGELSIRSTDASVTSIQIGVDAGADDSATANFGFGLSGMAVTTAYNTENILLGSASGELANFEKDFNKIREQIDQLAKDASYRGTNLLMGDDLTTFFNEDRTSSVTTSGGSFTADGMGISAADFSRSSSVQKSADEVRQGTASLRSFGSTLATDLGVIQNRQDFTQKTIDNLKEGADKLTVADQNEEGAKLLALQTRAQLSAITLSLASQQDQTVLRLF
jgi:flagellin